MLCFINGATYLNYKNIKTLDGNDKCEKHVESMGMRQVMFEMVTHSEEEFGVTGLAAAFLKDKDFGKSHSLKHCPHLILYRNGRPIVYDGDNLHLRFNREDIGHWISSNLKSHVEHLSDETFEHLTQASTGSTTGDWMIWLHKSACSDLTAVWEALASRLKYSKVVGEVDITLNPKTAERFSLTECQSILLFRHGKRYTYTGDAFDVHALANFAEVSYKNFEYKIVKPPLSPFDEKVEQLTNWLKTSEYGLITLIAVSSLLFSGILFLVCQESQQMANTAEKKDK
ncbi:hypothetical protein EB796_016322 [Bugula neritina]|uniref:Uncharacterized protein n=1 Tax=Bugula neritina TaxID=10212 RepID=A0A7J7JH01_BUGNE|nr:hypothetical protein EB796_016322 [Bugula neritina]